MNKTAKRTMNKTAGRIMNETAQETMNENAKKIKMRMQIPNERLAFNCQLGPGTLGTGPRSQNTGSYFWGGEQGKEQ